MVDRDLIKLLRSLLYFSTSTSTSTSIPSTFIPCVLLYGSMKLTNWVGCDWDNELSRILAQSYSLVWQDRTGQDRTGQDRTGQDRTGHSSWSQQRTRYVQCNVLYMLCLAHQPHSWMPYSPGLGWPVVTSLQPMTMQPDQCATCRLLSVVEIRWTIKITDFKW